MNLFQMKGFLTRAVPGGDDVCLQPSNHKKVDMIVEAQSLVQN